MIKPIQQQPIGTRQQFLLNWLLPIYERSQVKTGQKVINEINKNGQSIYRLAEQIRTLTNNPQDSLRPFWRWLRKTALTQLSNFCCNTTHLIMNGSTHSLQNINETVALQALKELSQNLNSASEALGPLIATEILGKNERAWTSLIALKETVNKGIKNYSQ